MSLLHDFVRARASSPCPVCGRLKFCLLDRRNAADPAKVICTKIESKVKWGEAGWLHVLRSDGGDRGHVRLHRQAIISVRVGSSLFTTLAEQFQADLDRTALVRFADSLGLDDQSLASLGVGWACANVLARHATPCRDAGCWSFPMSDAEGRVVGIRLRSVAGFKYAITGSQQGLFVPRDISVHDRILVAEGPTDTAALIGLGFAVIGRPSCTCGTKQLVAIVNRLRPPGVVIVSDNDEPGVRGAEALARVLSVYVREVRVIRPPEGIKDARLWKTSAPSAKAAAAEVNASIEAAAPTFPTIAVRHGGRRL